MLPSIAESIYLDNNATTRVHPEVIGYVSQAMSEAGNPSSSHKAGRLAKERLEMARQCIADCLGCAPKELFFTSGASESCNTVLRGVTKYTLRQLDSHGRCRSQEDCNISMSNRLHLLLSAFEHPAVWRTAAYLKQMYGIEVEEVPVTKNGVIDLEALARAIRPSTYLVSIMAANNEIGTVQPIAAISKLIAQKNEERVTLAAAAAAATTSIMSSSSSASSSCHVLPSHCRILFHTDATQMVGRHPVNVKEWGVDFLVGSAHKFHGCAGTGIVYMRQQERGDCPMEPMLTGGQQEHSFRSGTENVPGAVGMSIAMYLNLFGTYQRDFKRVLKLRKWAESKLLQKFPDGLCVINGYQASERLFNTISVSFQGVNGHDLSQQLAKKDISVSVGSACNLAKRSKTLQAIGLSPELESGTLRISMSVHTTSQEMKRFMQVLVRAIRQLSSVTKLSSSSSSSSSCLNVSRPSSPHNQLCFLNARWY